MFAWSGFPPAPKAALHAALHAAAANNSTASRLPPSLVVMPRIPAREKGNSCTGDGGENAYADVGSEEFVAYWYAPEPAAFTLTIGLPIGAGVAVGGLFGLEFEGGDGRFLAVAPIIELMHLDGHPIRFGMGVDVGHLPGLALAVGPFDCEDEFTIFE